jgi:hypothetical protein
LAEDGAQVVLNMWERTKRAYQSVVGIGSATWFTKSLLGRFWPRSLVDGRAARADLSLMEHGVFVIDCGHVSGVPDPLPPGHFDIGSGCRP